MGRPLLRMVVQVGRLEAKIRERAHYNPVHFVKERIAQRCYWGCWGCWEFTLSGKWAVTRLGSFSFSRRSLALFFSFSIPKVLLQAHCVVCSTYYVPGCIRYIGYYCSSTDFLLPCMMYLKEPLFSKYCTIWRTNTYKIQSLTFCHLYFTKL